MRPIIVLAIIMLFSTSAYYDLRVGTIPHSSPFVAQEEEHPPIPDEIDKIEEDDDQIESPGNISLPYEEVIVEAGQTVYGIVKSLHGENEMTYPPHKVVEDFEALNPNVTAHQIIIGHSYRFPIYRSTSQ
ncbi:hypothetical protein J2S74_001767 [Evansella vedderi]|uniref:LysM domain-containing protein n=1 Tax=Evansella vedderi TaxID=38282 RepID=A0ABT9ZT36_9BACI|nr:hypothetical protein [Evansella vedderi]MDQ0254392.1 hypothetical protein [Evansella vedderi]